MVDTRSFIAAFLRLVFLPETLFGPSFDVIDLDCTVDIEQFRDSRVVFEAPLNEDLVISPFDSLDAFLPLRQLTDGGAHLDAAAFYGGLPGIGLVAVAHLIADARKLNVELVQLIAELVYDFFL